MKKILEITAEQFLKSGISGHEYSSEGGLFYAGAGCDPFTIPGLLQGGYSASELGAGTIAETILHFVQGLGGSSFATMYGEDGGFYRLNLATDAISSLYTAPSSQGQDALLYKSEVYYSRNSTLSKTSNIDGDPDFGTSVDYKQFDNDIANHPLHVFQGILFAGDKDHLTSEDASGNYTITALQLPTDETIVDIDDDGYYLVIVTIKKGGTSHSSVINKFYFWDIVSQNWNIEWVVREGEVTAVSKYGSGRQLVAFMGSAGIQVFSYDQSPQALLPGHSSSLSAFQSDNLKPARGGVGRWRSQLAFAANGRLQTYGKVLGRTPNIFAIPIALTGIKAFYVNNFDAIYASATDDNLYKLSSGNSNPVLETSIIPLNHLYHIKGLKVFTGDALGASTSVQVQVTGDALGTTVIDETFNSTNSGLVNRRFWRNVNLKTEFARILITLTGGSNFRKLELWGDPLNVVNIP